MMKISGIEQYPASLGLCSASPLPNAQISILTSTVAFEQWAMGNKGAEFKLGSKHTRQILAGKQ